MKTPCEVEFEKWWIINFKGDLNNPARQFAELVWAVSWGRCYDLIRMAIKEDRKKSQND